MSRVQLLAGYSQIRTTFFTVNNRVIQKLQFSTSSNNSGSRSDDENNKLEKKLDEKKKSKEALEKLNKLLLTMTGEDSVSSAAKLDLAKPISKRRKDRKEDDSEKVETHEAQITTAAQKVAESIGGDVKQTQSELLAKLLNATQGDGTTTTNLSDLVKGMKVDQERPEAEQSKAQQVRQILQTVTDPSLSVGRPKIRSIKPPRELSTEKIDLFGSEPLGIFTEPQNDATEGVENKIWNQLYKKDLKLAVSHPPSNYFQQMILWTEQGKVWKFPIDNEQGLEEEKKIYFAEHVFLEKHLEPWCPSRGPLRHFMELVCVGLSKNPYLTVEAKKEHIFWFKDYFEKKKQLLRETGAIQDQESGQSDTKSSQKQIEQ